MSAAADVAADAATRDARAMCAKLTPAERDALIMLCKGYSVREAADLLGISMSGVNNRIDAVREKFDFCRTIECAVIATKAGLV